jgi:hypothetical protein
MAVRLPFDDRKLSGKRESRSTWTECGHCARFWPLDRQKTDMATNRPSDGPSAVANACSLLIRTGVNHRITIQYESATSVQELCRWNL